MITHEPQAPRRHRPLLSLEPVAVGVLCLLLLALVDVFVAHEHGASGDEPFYMAMARHPGGPHNFPYAYRVAVPWLVHVMPFSQVSSFTILGLAAVGVSAGALFALLGEFAIEPWLALGLTVGFTLSPTLWIITTRHFRSIDPASVMVMILGVLFIVRRERLALLITLTLGAAVRESTMFLIPFAYVFWADRVIDPEALRDIALTCLLPAVVYVLLRTQIDAVDKQYITGYSGPVLRARIDLVKSAPLGVELRRLAYTYGPLWIVAPFALCTSTFARAGLVLVILCVASMTYAFDWNRIIFLAAPVFFPSAAIVLNHRRRLTIAVIVALLAVDLGYGIYLQADGVIHGIDLTHGYVPVV